MRIRATGLDPDGPPLASAAAEDSSLIDEGGFTGIGTVDRPTAVVVEVAAKAVLADSGCVEDVDVEGGDDVVVVDAIEVVVVVGGGGATTSMCSKSAGMVRSLDRHDDRIA